jgi:hypothetical protein
VCFFLRVIALAMLCRDIVMNTTFTDDEILLIGWFFISNWLPTTLPVRVANYDESVFFSHLRLS